MIIITDIKHETIQKKNVLPRAALRRVSSHIGLQAVLNPLCAGPLRAGHQNSPMAVRISENTRPGEKAWMLVVHILLCAAPSVCFSPILLLHNTKSGSAYCLLVVLSMWLLRLLPLPVATCLLSLLLFSLIGLHTQDAAAAAHGFGVDSVLLIACFSLFVAADSTTLSLRTALWLLGASGARIRPLVIVFMTASFLGALVLPDFLVALVLSSVLEKAVLHLRCKFVSQQFRSPSQAKLQNRRATLSPIHYERLVQEMDSILQRKIQSSPPQSDKDSPEKPAAKATTRSGRERATLRKMASVMADICGRFTCGASWAALKSQSSSPDKSPNTTPPQASDEQPTLVTLSVRPESTKSGSSPSTSTTPAVALFRKDSPGARSSPPPSPSPGKMRRNSCPLSALPPNVTERLSDLTTRRAERASTSELQRRRSLSDPRSPSRRSTRSPSVASPTRVRPGGSFVGRGSSVVFPAEVAPEERESGSVTAENLAPHRRKGRRLSAIQQINFGDTADSRSSRKVLVPWNYSRDDLTRTSSRASEDLETVSNDKKTFIIGVVMTSTLASACAKSTRALIAAGVPRYSFKVSALVVLPVALCTTLLCWTALFFAYLSEYDELAPRSSTLAIRDVMQAKLCSMGKIELQERFCFAICLVATVACAVILFTSHAELVTCVTLAAFALVFGVPSVSGVPLRDVVAQLPWNIILIHGGSRWLSAALRDSGLAVWLVSSYTNERFRDMSATWQLLVLLAVASFVNEGGEQSGMLTAQLVPIITDMGAEAQRDPLFFAVPVAATCYLPVITPIAHLGLVFVYEHTTANVGEMVLLGLFLKVITTTAFTLSSSSYFAFYPTSTNDTLTTFVTD
ncbi:uncharacterized protein LOC142575933 isoform X2 [Dermacentor variabilis]|uniref:uncharacterized protein LOC142575933 isoform X2 n=1 Tax=Dermacentor variabilis TaxID=34621 RepID=UPI003F5BBA2D